jgi:hypothetical protein
LRKRGPSPFPLQKNHATLSRKQDLEQKERLNKSIGMKSVRKYFSEKIPWQQKQRGKIDARKKIFLLPDERENSDDGANCK